jgi:hypothetical protein
MWSDLEIGSINRRNPRLASVVIHGLGGLGKSSVALEYMYRHWDAYSVILWLYAGNRAKLDSQFVQLARLLGLPVEIGNVNNSREAVVHWIIHLGMIFLHRSR